LFLAGTRRRLEANGGDDAHAAWTGSYAGSPELPLRVEAAAWRGKPVFFRVIGPWSKPERMQPVQTGIVIRVAIPVMLTLSALVILLVWRNFRAGRGRIIGHHDTLPSDEKELALVR
jgi:hypothetical protein